MKLTDRHKLKSGTAFGYVVYIVTMPLLYRLLVWGGMTPPVVAISIFFYALAIGWLGQDVVAWLAEKLEDDDDDGDEWRRDAL